MSLKININFIKFLYLLFSIINMLGYLLGLSWDGYFALFPYSIVIIILLWLGFTYKFKFFVKKKFDVLELLFIKLGIIILVFTTISFIYCKYQIFQYIFVHSDAAENIVNNIIASAIVFTCWIPYSSFINIFKNYQNKYFAFKGDVFFVIVEELKKYYAKEITSEECMKCIKKLLFMHNQVTPIIFEQQLKNNNYENYLTHVSKCCNAFLLILDQEMSRIKIGKTKVSYDFIVDWIYLFNETEISNYNYKPNFNISIINDYYFDV